MRETLLGSSTLLAPEGRAGRPRPSGSQGGQLRPLVRDGSKAVPGDGEERLWRRDDLSEAKEAKRKLLEAYPGIGRWHRRAAAQCDKGNFETYTLMGRRRVVEPDYEGKPKFTERLNAPVKGTAADILKLTMARLWESHDAYPDALPILSVHDEVVIESNADVGPEVVQWLSANLREAVADVLGYEELAGEDVVETSVIEAWGTR